MDLKPPPQASTDNQNDGAVAEETSALRPSTNGDPDWEDIAEYDNVSVSYLSNKNFVKIGCDTLRLQKHRTDVTMKRMVMKNHTRVMVNM